MFRLLLLFLLSVSISSATIILTDETKKIDNFILEHAYDKTRALGIGDVHRIDFKPISSSEFNFGYVSGNSWVKIDVKNVSQESEFLLYFTAPYFEEYTVYEKDKNRWVKSEIGLFKKLKNRDVFDSNPVYRLNLLVGESKTYYIQLHSKFAQVGEFRIYNESSFLTHDKMMFLSVYIFAFGAIMMIILLNGFLAYRLKNRLYGYFATYVGFFAIFIALFSGIGLYFGLGSIYYELYVSAPFMLVFLILFTTKYIRTKKYTPKLHQFFTLSIVVYFISAILMLLDIDPWYKMISNYSILVFIMLVVAAVRITLLGQKTAKIYLYIMLPTLSTFVLMINVMNGSIANTHFNHYSFLYISFLSIIIFTLLLANKFYETKGLVNRDPLTRLFNRRYFTDIAEKYFATEQRNHKGLSAVMLDIDKFKTINQVYGQVVGDDVLVILSDVLREHSRDSDIPVRFGGEVFMILFPETSLENSEIIAERIRHKIENTIIEDKKKNVIKITVSVGVSIVRNGVDTSIERVIQRADEALYEAKSNGRNQVKVIV